MMVLNAISHQHRLQWQDQRSVKGLTATLTESVVSKPSTLAHGKRRKETPAEREKRILDQLRAQIHSEFATGALNESAPLEPASSLQASPPPEPAVEPQPVVEPVRWEITLLKPRVLMNISGVSVAKAVAELGIPVENVLVIHDDMQRDLGKVALKHGGSANGHNGIKSIIDHLRTNAFRRLRIGIGRPLQDDRSRDLVSDFVLGKFTPAERETLENVTYQTCLQQWPGLFLPSDDNRT
ncbi:hypothetical protein IWQ60_005710 [Tieghemiomyces parasiticus]|uniref:peptidyl-tRNA hydrolase n=1 Tax=Tieghemiomyces parasiticus TaxID=78921 RepID=A0A9W8A5V6_9FUNG|nr:hypothetical protein IWQ60_005710 [Tieghemiomyces parasiticus]